MGFYGMDDIRQQPLRSGQEPSMPFVGLDIGGANLKAADGHGRVATRPFAVWKAPDRLGEALREVLSAFPADAPLAVTMTAELADCFETKAEGVDRILAAVEAAAPGRPVHVWQTGAEFVSPDVARDIPRLVSAANWHLLATWIGRLVPRGEALLIDVGTTTTDLIPLQDGIPVPEGLTDVDRLLAGELVYTGIRRTAVAAVAASVPFRGRTCPLSAELFATLLDVHLILGHVPEDPHDVETADGRPAVRDKAEARLARMLCCDRTECDAAELRAVAEHLADCQERSLLAAVDALRARRGTDPQHVLLAGSGSFLADRIRARHPSLAGAKRIALSESFAGPVAEAACAFAAARLAEERLG
jgi:probable H4MPT-linked C1 transfer pathway protein